MAAAMQLPIEQSLHNCKLEGVASVRYAYASQHLDKVVLKHLTGRSSAAIYLHGATVTSWKIMGQEMLYLSPEASFEPGKAIRGGVPVVFPQQGSHPGSMPYNGFASSQIWKSGETDADASTGDVYASFSLEDNPETRAMWPHRFKLVLTVCLTPTAISMRLKLTNLNRDAQPFSCHVMLHNYLRVKDIEKTSVRGLQGGEYLDLLDPPDQRQRERDSSETVIFRGPEVARLYADPPAVGPRTVSDKSSATDLLLGCPGFTDWVVWNPHETKRSELPSDAWKKFVSVQPGRVLNPVVLYAGRSWEGMQFLRSVPALELKGSSAEGGSKVRQENGERNTSKPPSTEPKA